jgi:hypothetical protein
MLNHNYYLNIVRKITGSSFVGWITENDKKSLRVTIKGVENNLPLIGNEITLQTYAQLINGLIEVEEKDIKIDDGKIL